jgi:uncharacterized DUF497 family protein
VEFRWNDWSVEHIERHGVSAEEAEHVVLTARAPFPRYRGDGKWLVWGSTASSRSLQVVFVLEEDDIAFVIHARPLTRRERLRFRRMKKS